eukprot:scaffold1994_cov318-Prasinococcus_capsulatus_cf.AAC.2
MYELYDPCTVMFFFRNKVRRRRCTGRGTGARQALTRGWCRQRAAHHDRPGDGQQQQDQLGDGRQAGVHRHHRDGVPRRAQGPRPRGLAQGLQHQVPLLGQAQARARARV